MDIQIEPCRIHDAVFAWINYDPNRWFTRRLGQHGEIMKRRNETKENKELQQRIYNLRNPPYGKPMRIRDVAELLDVSESTVKTYSKKYLERK